MENSMTDIIISCNGRQYQLEQDAYADGIQFKAYAICLQDTPDEDGWQTYYEMYWYILDKYIDYDADGKPYVIQNCPDDESLLADWENPDGIIESGEYNVYQKRSV